MEQILKKIYKSRIFGLISILFFIAVCMGIGAFAAYVKHVSNPTEQAVTYFRAFMQQDMTQCTIFWTRKTATILARTDTRK